jgi:hypothetical protein
MVMGCKIRVWMPQPKTLDYAAPAQAVLAKFRILSRRGGVNNEASYSRVTHFLGLNFLSICSRGQ